MDSDLALAGSDQNLNGKQRSCQCFSLVKRRALYLSTVRNHYQRSEAELKSLPWLSAELKCELVTWEIVLFVHNVFELSKLVNVAVDVFSFESDFTQQVRLFATPRQWEDRVYLFVRLMCICLNLWCYFTQRVRLFAISNGEIWCICLFAPCVCADMIFVKNFTLPDIEAKNLHRKSA